MESGKFEGQVDFDISEVDSSGNCTSNEEEDDCEFSGSAELYVYIMEQGTNVTYYNDTDSIDLLAEEII